MLTLEGQIFIQSWASQGLVRTFDLDKDKDVLFRIYPNLKTGHAAD